MLSIASEAITFSLGAPALALNVFSLSIKLPIKMTEIKANLQAVSVVSMGVPGVISQWASYVTSLLSLAAASASAGVVLLYARDLNFCSSIIHPPCTKFQISVALAFISWFLLAISSYVMFWLLCSV
ncbi:CASP-like protein 5B2 [Vitis vinifera]|uniref:CASP-like protein 5B2 n=1 Tax=Vitis vinifera TaxID=29760 RepID=A0A438JXP3_VITVI|nr:CASP-like protein 5B2 [Vitis vinifera]